MKEIDISDRLITEHQIIVDSFMNFKITNLDINYAIPEI